MSGIGAQMLPPGGDEERGVTLLEAAFALALFGSTMALTNVILSEEADRQRNILLGRDLRMMTEVARSFVGGEYDHLRQELAGLPGGLAVMAIDMQRVSDDGYLPVSFVPGGSGTNSYGQSWMLMARGVDRMAPDRPAATLTVSAIDSDGDDIVDAEFMDGVEQNGELALEVILVTTGGSPIPAQDGNPAVIASGLPVAGIVSAADTARGAHGSWLMDISAYSGLAGYPSPGHLVALVALPGFDWLNHAADGMDDRTDDGNPLERCPNAEGQQLGDCSSDNRMYTDIRFDPSSGMAAIRDLRDLDFAPPEDTDLDGDPDVFAAVTGMSGIACGSDRPISLSSGTLLLDCPEVTFAGDVDIAGAVAAGSDMQVTGSVTASTFFAEAIGGQDLATGIHLAQLVSLDSTTAIPKPECDSSTGSPAIYVVPASFVSPDGSPLVGVQALAANSADPDAWTVRMTAAIDRDRDSDGEADVIELNSASDLVLVLAKCE